MVQAKEEGIFCRVDQGLINAVDKMTSRCAARGTSLQNETQRHKSSVKQKTTAQETCTMKTFQQSKRRARQSRQALEHMEVGATKKGRYMITSDSLAEYGLLSLKKQ